MINPQFVSRREAIRLAGAALLLAPWTAVADDDSFEFIAINDTHYIDKECGPFQASVVRQMRSDAPKAAFVCHAGDLSDGGDEEALTVIKGLYSEAAMPLHPVPGNHDFIIEMNRTGYDAAFPEKLNYSFIHAGWQFIAFDTTQGTDFANTNVSPATLAWLEEQGTKLDPTMPTFAFTHFPLGEGVEMRPLNADAVVERLLKFNLKWVHCGHWHGESQQPVGTAKLTTSRCCARLRSNRDGSPLKGWHVYRASPDGTLARRFASVPA
jgi:3',5'-cyclic AMP phosphodiesterase CpdA